MNQALSSQGAAGERWHSLDGLRAGAAALVFAHHLGVAALARDLVSGGHPVLGRIIGQCTASGVELFFVLSAVVLASPYIRGERQLRLGSYFLRRGERLLPPYWAAWLLAGLQIYLLTLFPTWWTEGSELPHFSWADWLAQVGIVYVGKNPYSFAWWSLTLEVSFYLVLPAIIPVFRHISRHRRGLLVAYACSVAIAVAGLAIDGLRVIPRLPDFLSYASCFCGGLIVAARGPLRPAERKAALIAALVWMTAAAAWSWLNPLVGWGFLYLGLLSYAMDRSTRLYRWLSAFPVVWLGERSYSFFLTHCTVIALVCHTISCFTEQKGVGYFLLTRSITLVVSAAVTIAVFHLVERRFARNLVTADYSLPWRSARLAVDPLLARAVALAQLATRFLALNIMKMRRGEARRPAQERPLEP
jgi:peptidoglycan/LPS O-acetylase OafA/YrhL